METGSRWTLAVATLAGATALVTSRRPSHTIVSSGR
jgi:hypothetical protein